MTKRERDMVLRIHKVLTAVPGVTNPAAAAAIADYHVEMQHVRGAVSMVLMDLVLAREPEDYQRVEQGLLEVEQWIANRSKSHWQRP